MGKRGRWYIRGWLAGCLGLVSLSAATISPEFDAPVNLNTEVWPPYNYVEHDVLTGVSVNIVKALLHELGRRDPINVYPSMRAKLMTDTHPRSMMFSMFRTPEREKRYKWIGPIGRDSIYFYQRKDSPLSIRTLEDAKAVPVVASRQAGLVFNKLIAAGFTNLDASANSSKAVYSKLLLGRADLAISDSPAGVRYLLNQLGIAQGELVQTPVKIVESDLYIATSLDFSDAEIAYWQQALDRLKARGVVEQIYRAFE